MTTIAHGPGSRGPRQRTSHLLLMTVIAALVAGTCASPAGSPSPSSGTAAQGSTSPTTTPTPTTPGSPTGGPDATKSPAPTGSWAKVDLPTLTPVASFVPTKAGKAGVAVDTAFRLTSLDGTPAASLAARVDVQPTIRLASAVVAADTVLLTPTAPLQPGSTYRFTLRRSDGTIAGAWAAVPATTLRVVGTLPSDAATGVPLDTGIEITFDQRGVAVAAVRDRFSISPRVDGRFEVHERAIAFVPSKPLDAFTMYAVTLRKGVPLEGTGQRLEQDVTFQFETKGEAQAPTQLWVSEPLVDSATSKRPTMEISIHSSDEESSTAIPTTLEFTVHRLDGLSAAVAAYRRLVAAPEWAVSAGAPIDTSGLTLIAQGTMPVRRVDLGDEEQQTWVQLPQTLAAGWYVLTLPYPDSPRQVLVQSTDLAAFTEVSETTSAIWVNSLRSGDPVPGAEVRLAGAALGTTDADGLRVATTPTSVRTSMRDGKDVFLTVRDGTGREVFVPVAEADLCAKCWTDGEASTDDAVDVWWRVLATDRTLYRPTDTIDVWGMVRKRDGGSVPSSVQVSLGSFDYSTDTDDIVTTETVRPDRNGVFSTRLAIRDLPPGEYEVGTWVGGVKIVTAALEVGRIVKPAWQMALAPSPHAVLSGKPVRTTVKATFFDGTAVAGAAIELGFDLDMEDGPPGKKATTASDGTTVVTLTPRIDVDDTSQWEWTQIYAKPVLPEEADLVTRESILVFASSAVLDASGTLQGDRLTVAGQVNDVDMARMQTLDANEDWDIDPAGAPRAGARVTLRITEVIPTRKQIGTAYDFITKRTSPVYRYGEREVLLGTRTVTTKADGTFTDAMDVPARDHDYRIKATYRDEAGRTISDEEYSVRPGETFASDTPELVDTRSTGADGPYAIGDTVKLGVRAGHPAPAADRYLFTVSHLGLQTVKVQSGPDFKTAFRASWVPNATINAVRFTGSFYEPVAEPYQADFRMADRRLDVQLRSDAARYAPGDKVRVTVRTRDRGGDPVAATVVLRAIDEKLYAMGAASPTSVLEDLYLPVSSGVLATAWSHSAPERGDGGGDTMGGDGDATPRSAFRDQVLFRQVTTGRDGRATVTFTLSDDLTAWRVSAAAVDAAFQAGDARLDVPVGLPFFVESTIAPDYLVGDQPVLRVRSYGSALHQGDRVTFRVAAPTLGVKPTTVTATAFQAASVRFPSLAKAGAYPVQITGTVGTGSSQRRDALIRVLQVVDTRSTQGRTSTATLTTGFRLQGGATGFTTVVLADGGRGRSLPILLGLTGTDTGRGDQAIAASVARTALQDSFGMPAEEVGATDIDLAPYGSGGIRLIPYGDTDLELTALAAFSNVSALDERGMRSELEMIRSNEGGSETRERMIVATAGLAALGVPVLADVRDAVAAPKLTLIERSWLALAALGAGDEALAGQLERAILADAGQRLGPWVRVDTQRAETTATVTARLAVVAAGIGDPLAADMDAYVEANPPKDTLVVLERALAARSWAERTPGTSAAATLTVDGRSRQIAIDPSEPVWLRLTPAQLASARMSPVSGTVIVTSSWEGPLDTASLNPTGIATFKRSVTPRGTLGLADTVVVDYTVRLDADADDGCHQVTDLVPSGLMPIALDRYYSEYEDEPSVTAEAPWRVEGQRVDFCVSRDDHVPIHHLRYVARVVTPGTYRWEPALIQSSIVRDRGAVLPASKLVIEAGAR